MSPEMAEMYTFWVFYIQLTEKMIYKRLETHNYIKNVDKAAQRCRYLPIVKMGLT